jgi:DNA repair protein RadD
VQAEIEQLMGTEELATAACADIVKACDVAKRSHVLIFAASVEHGGLVASKLRALTGQDVGEVYGDTHSDGRARSIKDFREGRLKFLVNMNVLTIGFDAPNVDMIALLRPTASPGLYYQMVGRGFRVAVEKDYCLVLDYGNNVLRHGPVDLLKPEKRQGAKGGMAPAKECPQCQALIHAAYRVCPECGFEFPPPEKKHRAKHGEDAVLSGEAVVNDLEVEEVFYQVHRKKGADEKAPRTMRVTYKPPGLNVDLISEWICVEHPEGTFPHRKAAQWWRARSNVVMPRDATEVVEIAQQGGLAKAKRIKVQYIPGERFPRIVSYELESIPSDFVPWHAKAADARDAEIEEAYKLADQPEPPF